MLLKIVAPSSECKASLIEGSGNMSLTVMALRPRKSIVMRGIIGSLLLSDRLETTTKLADQGEEHGSTIPARCMSCTASSITSK